MIKQSNLSNFRMPAEWEKQESTLIAWPHNKNDWPGRFENIPDVFAQIISQISKVQKVKILIQHNLVKKNIHPLLRKYKAKLKNIIFITIKTDRVWTRDSGPIYVVNKNKKILLDWKFNAWAKYNNYKYDNAINKKLNKIKNLELIKPKFKIQKKFKDIVLEGGSIDVNGKGTIITTKECLLSKVQQRNPGLKKKTSRIYLINILELKIQFG